MTSRRLFIQIVPVAGAALLAARSACAQDMVPESDPMAKQLGYVTDAARADKAKFKNWAPGHQCSNCQLFQGKPTDAAAVCPLFGTRKVSAKGWCSGYTKKM